MGSTIGRRRGLLYNRVGLQPCQIVPGTATFLAFIGVDSSDFVTESTYSIATVTFVWPIGGWGVFL